MWSVFRNEKGQTAIFVALMFNVLFVFFAMSLNVAMVIHDKINLQNSVDLGVYYAAQKQAEVLNAIAHQNYAIRQSWKLLSWRYRVLGTMGLDREVNHPIRTGAISDTPFSAAKNPTLCMTYKPTWEEVPPRENLCNSVQTRIPPLPQVRVIAGFLGINHGIAALSRQLRSQFKMQCEKNGAFNWWFASSVLHGFRLDQRNRKRVIFGLAQGLASQENDFIDLDGNSVLEGVRQTIQKNLTYANQQRLGEIKLFNSLSGVPPQAWLNEIKIAPTIIYTDVQVGEGCNATLKTIDRLPERTEARNMIYAPYPTGFSAGDLVPWADSGYGFLQDSDYQFSLGVEKNPWVMPYVGVKVETSPRQVFFPVEGSLKTVARAFAKPFGGRIGPWYGSQWDRGAPQSSGDETDPLLPPRVAAGGIMNDPQDPRRLPNYSRYPGDKLGLISNMAQNGLAGLRTLTSRFEFYKNVKEDIISGGANDILAWDGNRNAPPKIREYELAVIAPDLFDITYYSIEPNFTNNYWERINANRSRLGIPSDTPVRPDLGHNSNIIQAFSVQEQMKTGAPLQRPEPFFFVRDKSHLLTAWAPGPGTYNYGMGGLNALGKCELPDDDLKVKNPGSCVAGGGRTGYSVKLISRDYLLSNQIQAGGADASPNSILNPPPNDW